MADFTDPDAVKRALQKTGASTNWLDGGTDTAPVGYAPALSYPQPPDKLPEQPVPQDPDKLPPAAQMSVPADPPPQPATSDDGDVTITVKTPRRAKPAAAPVPAPAQAAPVDIGQGQPQPNPYEVAEADGVEDLPLDLSKSSRELQGDVAAAASRDLELLQERRDLKDAYLGQQQAIENKRAEVGAESLGRQRDTADATRGTGDEYRKQMEAELAAMQEKMANPPKDTVGMVFGLISTLAALSGKAQGAAAITGLGNIVNQRMKKWQGEIASNQAGMEGLGKLININELQGKNREAAEAELAKASAVEIISAAAAAKAQATTADQVAAADLAINEAKRVYSASELKARAQAAAAARRAKIYDAIGRAQSAEEREAIAAANQDVGQSVLRDYLKSQGQSAEVAGKTVDVEKGVAEIGKTQAEALAAQADAAKKWRGAQAGAPGSMVAGGRRVVNPEIWEGIEPATKAKYEQGATAANEAMLALKSYQDFIKKHGTESVGEGRAQAEALSMQAKLKMKEAANLGAWDAGSADALSQMLGDPAAWTGNTFQAIPQRIDLITKQLRDEQNARAAGLGLSNITEAETAAALNRVRGVQAAANGGKERYIRAYRTDIKKDVWVPESKMPELAQRLPGVYQIRD